MSAAGGQGAQLKTRLYLNNEGWIGDQNTTWPSASPHGEQRLFWVPKEYRERVLLPYRRTILRGDPIEIDLERMVYGREWQGCCKDRREDRDSGYTATSAVPDELSELSDGDNCSEEYFDAPSTVAREGAKASRSLAVSSMDAPSHF